MADNSTLAGKHIVLGVTGSIAAYKAAELVRLLRGEGAEVRVMMTAAACEFITPLTLQTLSDHPVAQGLLDADEETTMGHIALARWADWVLIAPASADTLARLVQGRSDDLLTAVCLASEARLIIAPAMNTKMWAHAATQGNLTVLMTRGAEVIGPASGEQACGEVGEGRLVEPSEIVAAMVALAAPRILAGKRVLITAGPTHEPIDPVRYIGNRSSGKMGFALAKVAENMGAVVTLVAGPVHLEVSQNIHRIDVKTAQEMADAVLSELARTGADVFIAAAAVADYRPQEVLVEKFKKIDRMTMPLTLVATPDIVATVAGRILKPFVVGFAAETDAARLEEYARDKLVRKKLDMVAANQVGGVLGFGTDDNALHVFWPRGNKVLPRASKLMLAHDLMTLIVEQLNASSTN